MKGQKYRAEPTTVDGFRFASKREARRYVELKLLERAGKIGGLEIQPRFDLCVGAMDGRRVKICTYVADFRYWDLVAKRSVVEDVKGVRTPVYRLKRKLMLALYGVDVQEI
jgi:hypothetical protein